MAIKWTQASISTLMFPEATAQFQKDEADLKATIADLEANCGALDKAVLALQKGMGIVAWSQKTSRIDGFGGGKIGRRFCVAFCFEYSFKNCL